MTQTHQSTIDWEAAGNEVVSHLRNLLRLDTRNPPGNEIIVAQYLRSVLEQEGIDCQIVGPTPDRASLIARIKGNEEAAPLLLMSHTDVVAVEKDRWTHDPFGAEIADSFLYGRGALDMKNMVAMELMSMLLLKRIGLPLQRDVIFLAAADEEMGGSMGARWVVQNHPKLLQAEYAINEGGGFGMEICGRKYYAIQTAEKGTARFRLRAKGRPGHGSIPHDDNAVIHLSQMLARLAQKRTPVHLTEAARGYITGIASAQPPELANAFLSILANEATTDADIDALPVEASLKDELHAIVRNTVTPTILRAGSQVNVIPSEAEARLDARLLPGWTPEMFLGELHALFGENAEIVFDETSQPLLADLDSPLYEIIRRVMKRYEPEATLIPILLTGATDAKAVVKLGTKVYGFAPDLYIGPDEGNRVHGHDERVGISSLQWGTRVLFEVVSEFVSRTSLV